MLPPSPRQNRVDPWGELVADPARGAWMGNRGCLHDDQGRIRRHHQGIRWIICRLEFRGRQRALMQPGQYTELFFLDEATGFAAGHRPCAECRAADFRAFAAAWAAGHCVEARSLRAPLIDAALDRARFAHRRKVTYTERLAALPDGVMVAGVEGETPCLVRQGRLWRWSFAGYLPSTARPERVEVLTPQPIVAVLAAGYPVQMHPSSEDPLA
jgi:hypothetical protein